MTVSRDTPAGRAYLDLQRKAKSEGRLTDELLSLYALEGFLARLSTSRHAASLVLKGGVLLAAFDARRPTRDVDLQAQALSNDADTVLAVVRDIAAAELADGLLFEPDGAAAEIIRDDDEYAGVRVSMSCQLATARISYHVDVNVGDPIFPAAQDILIPRLLGGDSIALRGYPITMVHAEKIVTAVARGTANTRWRDFGDVYVLAGQHPISGDELIAALDGVATHRLVDVQPLKTVLEGYAALAQSKYAAWRRKNARDELPVEFDELLADVIEFADPALTREVAALTWDPIARAWA